MNIFLIYVDKKSIYHGINLFAAASQYIDI